MDTIFGLIIGLVYVAVIVAFIAGMWKVYVKAGQPGWAVLIPFYNLYVLLQIAKRPGWWLILFLIPFVGLIVAIITSIDIARKFGKSGLFAVGLILLGFIFYPILGFGDATYNPDA
ncbi:DUF5684 domain-containing protein [Chitinimonas lacunae]|uniref:DUF5684 domain-containing protein n=1 Tax=Chitinimonas lacunae TaxID=1963018 RepID=A0ABV8MND1_9NEIS